MKTLLLNKGAAPVVLVYIQWVVQVDFPAVAVAALAKVTDKVSSAGIAAVAVLVVILRKL